MGATRRKGVSLKRFHCRKDFGNMAGHFHLAPLLHQLAVLVDEEGAALNAHELLAVHFLQLDHVELLAQGAVLVAEQLKREVVLALEVVVTLQAVLGNAENLTIGFLELLVVIAEVLALGGAAGGAVLRVEIQYQSLALEILQAEGFAAGGGYGKSRDFLADSNGHGRLLYLRWGVMLASRLRCSQKSRNE